MSDWPCNFDPDIPPPEDPQARLERSYLEEYLQTRGYSLKDIPYLPKEEARALMIEACKYASIKLAEVEMRSRLVHDLHGEG